MFDNTVMLLYISCVEPIIIYKDDDEDLDFKPRQITKFVRRYRRLSYFTDYQLNCDTFI